MMTREPERRTCDICGCDMIITRRVTRTTQACPHTADRLHRDERARRRYAAQTARIEAIVNRRDPA